MKQSLELKLGQKLAMTPQLQQAIRLLQLSVIDLRSDIQEALDSNPLLEVVETDDASRDANPANQETEGAADEAVSNPETSDVFERGTAGEELQQDYAWEDDSYVQLAAGGARNQEQWTGNEIDTRNSAPTTLHDHLEWQLRMLPLTERDRQIGETIIEAINDDGYLTVDVEEIATTLDLEPPLETDEVIVMLHQVQYFDPIGVAARDIADSLMIQLNHLAESTPFLETARLIVANHLDVMANRDMAKLKRVTRSTPEQLRGAITLIQSLNPRPGSVIQQGETRYIIPDVVVRKIEGHWQAMLNDEALPRLGVNKYYQSLIRRGDDSSQNRYLRDNLQEARWYIKSLQNRHETLLRVANEIIRRQQAFFDHGDAAMRPMVLHDIADALELHESTISRVTTNKYMQTPLGVFELKYFFSSHVSTTDGGTCSATAIRSHIRKLVENESPGKPISDNRIAELLSQQGICVARRTVAKYRELMSIPPSNMRKSLTL
jgi:RNA polymerase sigma-54 factor